MSAEARPVRRLLKSYKHEEAERLLTGLLKATPNDPELQAELGLLYAYTQREFEAIECWQRATGSNGADELHHILINYFACRAQLAAKLNIKDEKGEVARATLGGTPDPNIGITLAACLIVKNESKNLDRCLKSLVDICDEIVVVDTGSTDNTVEIAKKYGAKIGHFDWCQDFAAARNASLDLATTHWVLWIDADEELDSNSLNAVREGLIRPHFGGYFVRIVNYVGEEGTANQYVHSPVRIFQRRPEIRFAGRIHEQILQCFDEHGFLAANLSNVTLHHYGYRPSEMEEKQKLERTISMLEREVREHPRDSFHWFNLANAYSVGRRTADAERAARVCLNFVTETAPYAPVAYQILTSALIAQDKLDEALQECQVADLRGLTTVINEFDRAHALFKMERYSEALASIDKCLEMPWPQDLTGDYGIKTYKGDVLKAQILVKLGDAEGGLALAENAIRVDPTFGIAWYARGGALQALDRLAEAAESYAQASLYPGLEPCLRLAADLWREAGQASEAIDAYARWLESHPQDATALAGWLNACEESGDVERLRQGYSRLIENRIESAEIWVNYGRALVKSELLEEAFGAYAQALQVDPSYANAYFNGGDLLYAFGRYQDAAEWYEQGLRYAPTYAQGWFVLGNCLAQMGVTRGAEVAYEQVLAFDRDHHDARTNLATIREWAAA